MNNRFFVPEYSQAMVQLETEERITKLIRAAEKDERVLDNLSADELDDVLEYLSSAVKEKERNVEKKERELRIAERRMRKICAFPVMQSRLMERNIL